LCNVPSKLLEDVLRRSETESQVAQQLRKASFAIDSSIESALNAKVKGGLIEEVTFSLEDVSVFEVALADLRMLAREMQKVADCADEVLMYLEANRHVCQGQQALRATAKYSIRLKRDADSTVAIDAIREAVRITIDPKAEFDGSRVTTGVSLYYGIRLPPLCFALRGNKPPRAPVSWWARTLNRIGI
jgi:hypothetical protein